MTNIFAWSKVALSNQNADSGINFLEGTQLPSTVNDSCRQLMARVAELLEDLSAANATGGAANAQTVTLDSGFTALGAFKVCVITATLAVTGAATLDTNSIGAKPWRKITAAGEVELEAGDVNVNSRCINVYSSTAGGGSGAWILLNPATTAINAAAITALLASAAFTEAAQDATGAMVDASLFYTDAGPTLGRAALTGDVTAAAGSNATTLAIVNANVGSFGLATSVAQFVVNAKGLITAAANVAITMATAALDGLMSAADKTKLDGVATGANLYVHPNHSGDVTSVADGAQTLATVNGNVGSFGLAASVSQFTVNAKGLITAAANVAIAIASAAITDSTAAGRAMLTAATVAAQTALLDAATAALKGLMSAADKAKLDLVTSGKYTPTLFNGTNVAASTAYECRYLRIGSLVKVWGRVDIDPTASGSPTELGVSLPIASNFVELADCAGTAAAHLVTEALAIYADFANNRAKIDGQSGTTANHAVYFNFGYEII